MPGTKRQITIVYRKKIGSLLADQSLEGWEILVTLKINS